MRAPAARSIGGMDGVASGADPSCETSFSDTRYLIGGYVCTGGVQLLCRNANSIKFSNLQVLTRWLPRCGANVKSRFRDLRARPPRNRIRTAPRRRGLPLGTAVPKLTAA